jgi:hypothetical protein
MICKKTYANRSSLIRHMNEKHSDKALWYCNLCGDKVTRRADVDRHSERNHDGRTAIALEKKPKNPPRVHESRAKKQERRREFYTSKHKDSAKSSKHGYPPRARAPVHTTTVQNTHNYPDHLPSATTTNTGQHHRRRESTASSEHHLRNAVPCHNSGGAKQGSHSSKHKLLPSPKRPQHSDKGSKRTHHRPTHATKSGPKKLVGRLEQSYCTSSPRRAERWKPSATISTAATSPRTSPAKLRKPA